MRLLVDSMCPCEVLIRWSFQNLFHTVPSFPEDYVAVVR